ncbi:Flp family type IVb pilin [Sphingopyxis sp. J-6]|uniref:Flp family type IVb pilin n=1 Tax=Sphingopyxis sp. J-6 TaxID=3122054 RepID=UPI00398417AA
MKNFLKNFVRDESGASAAEYVLILAIVGSTIAVGALALGGAISDSLTAAGTAIESYEIEPAAG